ISLQREHSRRTLLKHGSLVSAYGSRVRYVHKANRRTSSALNAGILAEARQIIGEFIVQDRVAYRAARASDPDEVPRDPARGVIDETRSPRSVGVDDRGGHATSISPSGVSRKPGAVHSTK